MTLEHDAATKYEFFLHKTNTEGTNIVNVCICLYLSVVRFFVELIDRRPDSVTCQ